MPELGQKHECEECSTKFYDLGKPGVICPKCGWNPDGVTEAEDKDENGDD